MRGKFSLQILMIALTSTLVVGSSVGISLYSYIQSSKLLSKEFESSADIIAKNFSFQAFDGIIVQDPYVLDLLCKGVFEEENIIYALVYDDKKNLLYKLYKKTENHYSSFTIRENLELKNDFIYSQKNYDSGMLDIIKTVSDRYEKDRFIGYIRIGIRLDDITQLKDKLVKNFLIILFIVLCMASFISYILVKNLTRQLQKVVHAMANITLSNDLAEQIEYESSIREVYEIQIHFNQMTKQLMMSQNELEKHKINLELIVKERTHELEVTHKALVNKAVEAGRAQLSAMVLHNIGNAITPVSVNIEQLKKNTLKETCQYLLECYNDIAGHKDDLNHYMTKNQRGIQVVQYMETLINDLGVQQKTINDIVDKSSVSIDYVAQILSLQRSYAPGKDEIKESINFNLLVEDALKIQESSIAKREIILEKDFGHGLTKMTIEKNKLLQVLVNFIKNSCDAIDDNLEKQPHKIKIATFQKDNRISFKIFDTGCGVEPDKLKEIFKFGVSTKGSSGFGLYYCKSFVEANNGTLTIESKGKNQGATIIMKFNL
jgi:signal transduction histidine kinase